MAEETNFEKGALVTPASLELKRLQSQKSPISGAPTTGDILRASGTTAGPPGVKPANMTNQERAIARMNGAMMNAYAPDVHRFNKLTTYNASHHGRNFERYHSHNGFKTLGFSPFRDNEAYYNKNTSLWDDAQRGIVTAGKLFWHAAKGSAANWKNPFSLEPDAEESDEMERLMSIGQSSRKGFGASAINFGVNSAYGLGVMGEVLAEEAALAAATWFSGGSLGGLAGLKTAMNVKKLLGAFSLGKAAKSFSSAFRAASKITDARQLWGVARGIGKGADALLPFENTRALLTGAGKTAARWDSLDNMAKATKAFGSFYRDVREINAVTYESKLEGGGVQNEVIEGLMSDFRKKNGRDPSDQEAKAIYGEGHKAGYLASQMNAIGIYISNKIVLDKALKGIPGMAQADDVARRTMKGTLLKVQDWAKKGVNPWEVASGIKKYGKAAFYKQTFNPKNLAKGGLGYLSANLMEGTQEVYQEAVANGITSYYMNAYNNPSRVGGAEFQAKMLGGLKSQMSGQGMETFLSGFLMAGPMTAAQSAFFGAVDLGRKSKLKIQDKQFKADPANAGKTSPFEQQLNAEKDYDNKVVDALNDMTKDPKKYFSALEQNARTQVDLDRLGDMAAADGDTHAAKSIKDESLTNHIITLLESGHFEIFQDQLKGLKDLEVQELQEAFDEPADAKKTVSQRIDTVLKRTEQIKDTYEKYQQKTNPFAMREDPLSYMAFEHARNIAIRNDVTYQRVGERMTDVLNQFNSEMPFSKANAADFTNLFVVGDEISEGIDRIGLISEIQLINGQIQGLSDSIPEQKAQKDKLIQKRDDLKSLSGTLQAYASSYKVTQSVNQTEEEHAKNMDTFIETEKVFKEAYSNYVKNLAKGTGQPVLDSAIDSSFEKLSDYWKLHTDHQDVANAVNIMQNPDMYRIATLRLREAMDKAFENRKESLKESLADYKKKHLVNAFLNDLFTKYNVFVEPEEAEAYVSNNMVPETFYDADTMEEIEPGSDKYKGIMALIDQYDEIYFDETGERLIRTEVPENLERTAGYDTATGKTTYQEFQPKDAKDKRSIKNIAEEFGFNHLESESPVDALEVLKAIARSKNGYVPRAQKKLAQALLAFIKPGTLIRFKNGHRTNSTFDTVNGIIVDANFSAEGFENANIPIEFSILNAVMQQVASESLADPEFNDRITALREQFSETLTENDRKYFAYALKNNQQFVAEAMTNADLQAEMGKKPFEGKMTEQTTEAKTMWESFMDSIYEALEKIFGVTRGKSLYQEAMNVITNKLAQPGVAGPSAVPSVLAETETEEDEIDIEEDEPELDQMLRAKFNEIVNAMPAADKVGMNFETWKQSDSVAISMRNKYNADKIKKKTATPGGATVMTEAEQVRRLTSLGYQISEINNMKKDGKQDDIDNIIKNDIKKKIQIRSVDSKGNVTYIEADYDQPIAARPNVIAAIDKAVKTLEDANVGLTADEKNYIQRVQVGVDENTGEPIYKQKEGTPLYERVSSVVKDKFEGTTKEATDRGTIIDSLLRDFLKGDILDIRQFRNAYTKYQKEHSSAVFSEGMLNDLFDKFRSVQILLKSNGLTVISNLPGLYGKIGNRHTAGAVDLIAYDAAGRVYIIDLKTSTQDRRAQYKLETDLENEFGARYSEIKEAIKGGSEKKKSLSETINSTRISDADKEKLRKVAEANPTEDYIYFFKDQDARQQNAYKELLRQSTGLVADMLTIFPLLTSKTGKIFTKVEFQKEGKDHSMRVETYDIHDKLGLVNEATYPENPIDRKAVTPTPTTGKVPFNGIETTEFNIPGVTMEGFTIDGNYYNVLSHSGRAKTLVNINGVIVPFYLTSGSGGKGLIPGWYPFGGIGKDGWLNKTGKPDMETYYSRLIGQENADLLKAIAAKLNEQYGTDAEVFKNPDADPTTIVRPITTLLDKVEDYINSKLLFTPTSNKQTDTVTNFERNMTQLGEALTSARTPEPTATPTDIEAKKAERRKRYYNGPANRMVQVQKDSENTPVTQEQIEEIEQVIEKAKELGWDKNRLFRQLSSMGYSYAFGVNPEGYRNYLEDRLSGKTNIKVTNEYNFFTQLDAELAALEGTTTEEQPTEETNDEKVAKLRAQEQKDLLNAIPNIESYKDAEGNVDKSKLSPLELQMYNEIYDRYDKLISPLLGIAPQPKGRVKVKAFRTTGTFSSKVQYAQRGAGEYYALDKPFQDSAVPGEVTEVEVEYDTNKTLDATTVAGQQEFMAIKMSAINGKKFSSQDEMNEAVRTAMLEAGYESLIGRIDEDLPSAGKELVIYTRMPNQGSETRDKQEMEEEFEEPIPEEREPVREKTNHEINFETSPFQYRPTATTLGYWNDIEGRIVYFSKKTGEEILNANRLRRAAQKTFDPNNKKTHANFKFWWNNLLNDRQRYAIVDGLSDNLWTAVGTQDDMYSEEYQIMERLRGMKFKPTKFNKGEFKDVSEKVWFSDNGASLDLFVLDTLIGDINTTFAEGSDEQDIQNMVIDIIKQYPNGITKADLKEKLRDDSLQVKFEELLDKYVSQYGVDLNTMFPMLDIYGEQLKKTKSIQEINEQEERENEGPSTDQETPGGQRTRTEVAPRFQGKVIVTNFSSDTPLVKDIPGVTYGTDLYAQALPKFFTPEVLAIMANASISGENQLVNSIFKVAKFLSEGKEITAENVKDINSILGLSVYVKNKFLSDPKFPYSDRPKNQQLTLDTLTRLKEAIDNQVVKDARAIANNGGTVVFDNNSLITHPGVDEVLISKSSDDYQKKAPTSESRRNFDALISNVNYIDISGKDLVDYLKGTETLRYTLDPKLKNIREALSKAEDRLAVAKIITDTGILSDMGVLDQILKEQNLTREELRELSSNAKARFKGTLAFADIAQRIKPGLPIEERIIQYTDKDGNVKTGVIMEVIGFVDNVEVAPYTGKESMSDLQDQSKWVTFTVGEIPYKLFDVKTTPPVTATPDITQQSDDLLKAEQANKAAAVEAFKNKINDDDFKNESVDDAEDDLFDGLQECPF